MKKKSLFLVLAMVLMLMVSAVTVSAAEIVKEGSCGTNVTYTLDSDGVLTISGEGAMADYTSSKKAGWNSSNVTKVVVEEGVTTIGEYAFYSMESIEEVVLPEGLTTIGERAFFGTDNLYSVKFPESVTTMGRRAFYSSGVTILRLSKGLTEISEDAFRECDQLWRVEIHENVQSIDVDAFRGCKVLEEVYYYGTEAQWAEIAVGSELKNVERMYFVKPGECSHIEYHAESFIDPTCYEPGRRPCLICDLCGEIFDGGEEVPALGHKMSSWQVNTPKAGQQTRHCTNDGCTVKETKAMEGSSFNDVTKNDYFYTPVLWAANNGVTAGTGNGMFSPNATCTRAQVVTFLWRAAGQPKAESAKNPFSDVAKGQYYYDAVLWAVENEITAGTSATTFSPDNTVQRDQFVTFLYRFAKNVDEDVTTGNLQKMVPFGDISSSQYYYEPVVWATQYGYCSGMGNGNFTPAGGCTRGQTVTFLHRYFSGEALDDLTAIGLNRTYYPIGDMNYNTPKLTTSTFPNNTSAKVTWYSDNENVVKVSADGTLTPVGKGTARVYAQCGNVKNYCTVENPDYDLGWNVYSAMRRIDGSISNLPPMAGTYVDSEGKMHKVVIVFHKYYNVLGGVVTRFFTVVDGSLEQPVEYYEKAADRAYGAQKLALMDKVIEYQQMINNHQKYFTQYYEKYEDYWVPVGH